ncbi:MAG: AtpZ/AtpI family protein [Pirellulales bacterium]|nr:AtpZ/AtpI family protein [Pirellulales bacterium]
MTDQPDDRSPLAVAAAWASLVTTIALEMALPALLGHWVDLRLGSGPWLLLLGAVFGLTAGMWHLLRLTVKNTPRRGNSDSSGDRPDSTLRESENQDLQ